MKDLLNRLRDTEPAELRGVLYGFATALAAFLVSLQPALDKAQGWQEAGIIVLLGLLNISQGKSTKKAVYSPASARQLKQAGYVEAKAEATEARSQAAKRGAEVKAAKAAEVEAVSVPSKKPPVKKRRTGKRVS